MKSVRRDCTGQQKMTAVYPEHPNMMPAACKLLMTDAAVKQIGIGFLDWWPVSLCDFLVAERRVLSIALRERRQGGAERW